MVNKTTEDFEKDRNKQVSGIRSTLDYAMGVVIIIIGIYFIVRYRPDITWIAFGIISILYGIWRLYRGYKKNYFK